MKHWIKAARLYVVGASVLPAVLGGLLAFHETGKFHPLMFLLTVLGVAAIHMGSNLINDYFDYKSGVDLNNPDAVYPFSGGSRILLDGELSLSAVRRGALICYGFAALLGIILTLTAGIWVLIIGVFGVVTGYLYVHPRIHLLNRGVGELLVGIDFGVLIVVGAYYVQTSAFSWSSFLISLPVAIVIALILVINEFPDYAGDKAGGKNTIVVRLGRERASRMLVALYVLMGLVILITVAAGFASPWFLSALLAIPFGIKASQVALKHHDDIPRLVPANISVINSHLFVNSWLAASCLMVEGWFPLGILAMLGILFWQVTTMIKLGFWSAHAA